MATVGDFGEKEMWVREIRLTANSACDPEIPTDFPKFSPVSRRFFHLPALKFSRVVSL